RRAADERGAAWFGHVKRRKLRVRGKPPLQGKTSWARAYSFFWDWKSDSQELRRKNTTVAQESGPFRRILTSSLQMNSLPTSSTRRKQLMRPASRTLIHRVFRRVSVARDHVDFDVFALLVLHF